MTTLALLLLIQSLSSEVWTERDQAEQVLAGKSFTVQQWQCFRAKLPTAVRNRWGARLLDSLVPPSVSVWFDKDNLGLLTYDTREDRDYPPPFGEPWLRRRDGELPWGPNDYIPYVRCRREAKFCAYRFLVESRDPEKVRLWLEDMRLMSVGRDTVIVRTLFAIPLLYQPSRYHSAGNSYAYAPDLVVRYRSPVLLRPNRVPLTGDWVVP